jgi:hypothetical protein
MTRTAQTIIKVGNHIWGLEVVEAEKNWQIISHMNGNTRVEVVWRSIESRENIIAFADILTRYENTTVTAANVETVAHKLIATA